MPDAILSLIKLAQAEKSQLKHFADFNVNSMSFTPADLAIAIKKRIPEFEINYKINPILQSIADSWPDKLDDSVARKEWGWKPKYDLDSMVDDMIINLTQKLKS
jgi:nucleoside-diphosphate-sugar epimerase